MMHDSRTLNYTRIGMQFLERILRANISVGGTDKLEDRPTMFVINHFTRAETFIMPYVIDKYTNKYIHTLADDSLFKGKLGEYFQEMGVVSTKEPNRNECKRNPAEATHQHGAPADPLFRSKAFLAHGDCSVLVMRTRSLVTMAVINAV